MTSRQVTPRAHYEPRESPAPSGRLILLAAGASTLWVAVWIGIQISGRLG